MCLFLWRFEQIRILVRISVPLPSSDLFVYMPPTFWIYGIGKKTIRKKLNFGIWVSFLWCFLCVAVAADHFRIEIGGPWNSWNACQRQMKGVPLCVKAKFQCYEAKWIGWRHVLDKMACWRPRFGVTFSSWWVSIENVRLIWKQFLALEDMVDVLEY